MTEPKRCCEKCYCQDLRESHDKRAHSPYWSTCCMKKTCPCHTPVSEPSLQETCSKGVCCTIQYGEDAGVCMLDNCSCHTPTPPPTEGWEEQFIEQGADLEHTRWAKWQAYLYSKCIKNNDGSLTIPAESVAHWQRQIDTPYAELSEREKESDRKEVRTYLPLITKCLAEQKARMVEVVEDYRREKTLILSSTGHQVIHDIIKALSK